MKTFFATALAYLFFLNASLQAQCIDATLIDPTAICPMIWLPVCGCNGQTYSNDCEAIHFGGVTSWTDGECPIDTVQTCLTLPNGVSFGLCELALGVANTDSGCVTISGCSSIGSDGIDYAGYFYGSTWECASACMQDTVIVIPCIQDSLINFAVDCIAEYIPVCGCDEHTYYNACEAMYHYGVSTWIEGPCQAFCTPIPTGVTFGECAMPLGIAQTAEGCVYLSGCSTIGSDGADYAGYFYDLMEECQAACVGNGIIEEREVLSVFPNPANESIQTSTGVQKVEIYNHLGQIILKSNQAKSDVTHVENGLYLVKLIGKNSTQIQPLLIQHQ